MTTTPEPGPTVGGATGPIEGADRRAAEPADSPWGAQAPGGNPPEASVGPGRHTGMLLGEDTGDDDYAELGGEG
jgi:hypothetical protein